MAEDWLLITDKAKEKLRIGELVETWTPPAHRGVITDKWLKEYALATRDPNPLWWDDEFAAREGRFGRRVAPTAFCTLFNPMEQAGLCPASAFWAEIRGVPDNGRHWGGHAAYNKVEIKRPLRLGDRVTCEIRNLDCYEKHGKQNLLVCVETEYKMFDEAGETIAVCVYGNMSQFAYPEGAGKEG
jgi:acyl dehydratase